MRRVSLKKQKRIDNIRHGKCEEEAVLVSNQIKKTTNKSIVIAKSKIKNSKNGKTAIKSWIPITSSFWLISNTSSVLDIVKKYKKISLISTDNGSTKKQLLYNKTFSKKIKFQLIEQ